MSQSNGPVPRPGILDIAAYVGGEHHGTIRLASNEGALGPSPRAMEAYAQAAATLHRYPDGASAALREAIARRFGLDAGRIVCGAGSDEIISLLIRAYAGPGDEVLYSQYGFLMYPIGARSVGATPVTAPETDLTADVESLLSRVTPRTKLVFLANPNNPTGTYLPTSEIERLHAGLPPHVLLVIDAAYAEYMNRNDYTAGAELVERFPNVVMTRTFSKIFALGSLRIGWAYCPAAVADVLNRVRGPFNVSTAAHVAGIAAVEDTEFLERSRQHNEQWREWFTRQVRGLGLTVHPSVTNFVLVDFQGQKPGKDDAEAARQFLKGRSILVRQMPSYGLPSCLRVTIGTEAEMRAVVDALKAFLEG
ncbi:histidinol-phosphate transaminase [Azospirillum thermophilum]|uniref:Histidinol-phosphate aminotransferase n=1 Tax=Azospirillum thermophilum TaxID=2202148 RepID=A0A2S2CWY4_9PROT|nr:histidinol-phosphate transaminase [Azospirillum thermophilum]AWK88910.1 histidinol-phosphate transaminase [Azospirillum thermophilum]